jgi:cell division protein ZapA
MCKIRDAGKIKARERIAVLAALNLAFDTPAKPASPAHLAQDEQADPEGQMRQWLARLDPVLGEDGRLL